MREAIPRALDGERLDRVIALLTGLPRARVAELVAAGDVRVGGTASGTRSRRVAEGEVVEVDLPPDVLEAPRPAPDPGVIPRVTGSCSPSEPSPASRSRLGVRASVSSEPRCVVR